MNVNEIGFMKKNMSTKVTRTLSFKHLFKLHPLFASNLSQSLWGLEEGLGIKGWGWLMFVLATSSSTF